MSDDRYFRVYYDRIEQDEKFDGIRTDRSVMGCWVLLGIEADKSWPSPFYPPPTVPRPVLLTLVERGIVDPAGDGKYRLHGMDNERAGRSRRAADAASARWRNATGNASGNAERIATASAPNMPSRTEPSKAKPSIARDGLPNLDGVVAGIWETATGRSVIASGNHVQDYLDDACRRHPPSEVGAAIIRARKQFDHIPDGPQLVSAMRPILDPFVDAKATAAKEREAAERAASRRRTEATLEGIHRMGGHDAESRPGCPMCEAVA